MPRKAREAPEIRRRPGSDRYYVYWYDADTRREEKIALRTSDEGEAYRRYAQLLLLEGDVIFRPRGPGGLTVTQALDDYLREHVREKCADPVRQEDAARNLKAYFKDTEISKIDIPASRRYADARRRGDIGGNKWGCRKQASEGTIRRELNVLMAAANHARRWKRIAELPSIELPVARVIGVDDEAPYYTKKELKTLIDAAEGDLKHFIILAYWTGARRGSIENLTVLQVDWPNRRIRLQPTGKRATKKRQPIVPILAEMEPSLRALCEGKTDGRLFSRIDFYHRFNTLALSLGFEGRAHPHVLRHTRATHLLQDGVGIYHVAKLLGDTIATVERVYGHPPSADDLAVAIGG